MNLTLDRTGPLTIATITGNFDQSDADTLAEELHPVVAPAGARLAIDLSNLNQINSAGLSVLINLVTRSRLSGARVVLINPSAFIRQVFGVTRLDKWFEIVSDRAAALGATSDDTPAD